MKTIITRIPVLCLIFLFQTFLKAQNDEDYAYRGGNADGFAIEILESTTCATPFHYYAYLGGLRHPKVLARAFGIADYTAVRYLEMLDPRLTAEVEARIARR